MFAIRFLLEGTFGFAFLLFEVLGTCQKPPVIVNGGEGILPGKRNPRLNIIPSNRANQQGGYQRVASGGLWLKILLASLHQKS